MEWFQAIVGGGLVGGIVVALLHMWHVRTDKTRERKLEAADELLSASVRALLAVRDVTRAAQEDGASGDATQAALERARELRDEVHVRFARVLLMNGASTEATNEAQRLAGWIDLATISVEREPTGSLSTAMLIPLPVGTSRPSSRVANTRTSASGAPRYVFRRATTRSRLFLRNS